MEATPPPSRRNASLHPTAPPHTTSSSKGVNSRRRTPPLHLFLSLLLLLLPEYSDASMCIERYSCEIGEEKRVVKCVDPDIDVVPMCLNPSLLQISLHSTKIRSLYIASLRFYTDLRHVNLSDNLITTIEAKSFEFQKNLEELHLADNRLSNIRPDTFKGLDNLTVLSLQGNLIENITERSFDNLYRLELLDLSRNRLDYIDMNAFKNLKQLRVLSLADNLFTEIPSNALAHVPHLAELSMGMNNFSYLAREDFESLRLLTTLDLSSVNLRDRLSPDTFWSLGNLRFLRLDDCGLETIPTEALRTLDRLEHLFINRNRFLTLDDAVLDGNRRLQELEIIGCPDLEKLSSGTFKNNLDLRRVSISRNPKLWLIPSGTFKTLSQLKYLDIHGNNLQTLDKDAALWNDIDVWQIQYNAFECNCSVAWLRNELLRNHSSSYLSHIVVCASPPRLSNTPITETQMTDLSCGLGPATQGLVIGTIVVLSLSVIVGVILFFLCRSRRSSCLAHLIKRPSWNGRVPANDFRDYPSDYPEYIMAPHKPVPVTEL